MPQQGEQQPTLSASYTSPTNSPFQISSQLDLSLSPSSSHPTAEETKQQRVAYLAQLRKAASTVQASVNKELTSRMEQDKIREAEEASKSDSGPAGKKKKVKAVDDEAEEQNYGEEVVEDSD